MMTVLKVLNGLAICTPLFVFFDYHKRSNVHWAILYVICFTVFWIFIFHPLVMYNGMLLAILIPLLLVLFLVIARLSKDRFNKRGRDQRIIDRFD